MLFSSTKTQFYVRLTDKELAFNQESAPRRMDDPIFNFNILTVIDNHSPMRVDAVLLQYNNETTYCVHI